jgi:hypothetical protein
MRTFYVLRIKNAYTRIILPYCLMLWQQLEMFLLAARCTSMVDSS